MIFLPPFSSGLSSMPDIHDPHALNLGFFVNDDSERREQQGNRYTEEPIAKPAYLSHPGESEA
jgi:hypothetical protein